MCPNRRDYTRLPRVCLAQCPVWVVGRESSALAVFLGRHVARLDIDPEGDGEKQLDEVDRKLLAPRPHTIAECIPCIEGVRRLAENASEVAVRASEALGAATERRAAARPFQRVKAGASRLQE